MFYFYIIQSDKNEQLYYGSTKDLKKRLKEHNDGLAIVLHAHNQQKLTLSENGVYLP